MRTSTMIDPDHVIPEPAITREAAEPSLWEHYQRYHRQGLNVFARGEDGGMLYLIHLTHYRDLERGFVKSERVRKGQERIIAILTPALAMTFGLFVAMVAVWLGGKH